MDLRIPGSYKKWKHQEVKTPRMHKPGVFRIRWIRTFVLGEIQGKAFAFTQ